MRSERPLCAGTARRTTVGNDEVVKTLFDWWATTEHEAIPHGHGAGRRSPQYPLASGEGAS